MPYYVQADANHITEQLSRFPNIVTCPSELVALSAALGYAQVTGLPVCLRLRPPNVNG